MKLLKVFLLVFLGLSAVAQQPVGPTVTIPVIASPSPRNPTGITADSLKVTDQNMPVTGASLLRGAEFPLELGVLIDTSDSQRRVRLDDLLKATSQFVGEIMHDPQDRLFSLQFDNAPHATEWLTKEQWQSSKIKVRFGGATALFDAVATASKERMGPRDWHKPTRRVLLLISDGGDNQSHVTFDDAVSEALQTGTVIFTIETDPSGPGRSLQGEKVLEKFARMTGGESYTEIGKRALPNLFADIKGRLAGLYYLSYVPPDASKRGLHYVEVKPAPREKLKLSYARKYFWNP